MVTAECKSPSNLPTRIQHHSNDTHQDPASKDLLFSNLLLVCLAANYCCRTG